MTAEKTDALVIRLVDFSETSKIVTLFTRDFGKIGVIAKGAKRLKSAFEVALDLLTACRIVFLRKSSASLDILTEAQLVSRFHAPGDLNRLYSAYYLAELLDGLTEEYDPHPELFDEALRTLARLQTELPAPLVTLHFELKLLQEIGHGLDLSGCTRCAELRTTSRHYRYLAQSGLVCDACVAEDPGWAAESPLVSAGVLALLAILLEGPESQWTKLNISPAQWTELRRIVTAAVSLPLGRRPRMLGMVKFK